MIGRRMNKHTQNNNALTGSRNCWPDANSDVLGGSHTWAYHHTAVSVNQIGRDQLRTPNHLSMGYSLRAENVYYIHRLAAVNLISTIEWD